MRLASHGSEEDLVCLFNPDGCEIMPIINDKCQVVPRKAEGTHELPKRMHSQENRPAVPTVDYPLGPREKLHPISRNLLFDHAVRNLLNRPS